MSKDMDRLSEENYRQRNESYIQRLRDERDEKLKKRYEELRETTLEEKKEDK
jgi:phosphoribosyl-ATP pyrophosphohydrolase